MAQFDVFRNAGAPMYPLVLDVQADVLALLATRMVVPLAPCARYRPKPITRLNPIVTVRGTEYVLLFQDMAAVPRAHLRTPFASLAKQRGDLIAALDLLFTGI
jgi:toxin CcdB